MGEYKLTLFFPKYKIVKFGAFLGKLVNVSVTLNML